MMSLAYVITILVTTGDPDGVRVVEKSNWTGRGLVFARSDLAAELYSDLRSLGVYVLLGDDPDEEFESQIYVGQGEDVGKRLKQHQSDDSKDFWTDTVVFVSGNETLNRAHISYLESSLIRLATDAKRVRCANGTQPAIPKMAPTDVATAEGFLAEMKAIFPVLGVNAFDVPRAQPSGLRRYHLAGPNASGEGEERSDGFMVFAGAEARGEEVTSIGASSKRLRARLITAGTLVPDGENYRLTEDALFRSPSTAAMVLLARQANGRVEWKDESGVTLKERQIQQAVDAGQG